MLYLLLITWVYPDQPPYSYQIDLATEEACQRARRGVYEQLADIRQRTLKFEGEKIRLSGVDPHVASLMLAGIKVPDASAVCIQR